MNKRGVVPALFVLLFLVAASGVMQANAISGSLPFAMFGAAESGGSTLFTSTSESATDTQTSGVGTGDFAAVLPVGISFGAVTLNDLGVGSGGGFSITNSTWGTFKATGGSIVLRTPTFLNVDLTGTFVPGPGFPSTTTAGPVVAHVSFTQTGPSVSGSFTLASVPEPASMALLGSGILLVGWLVRRRTA